MHWGQPHNFVWLWVLGLMIGFFYFSSWRKQAQMRLFGELDLVQRLVASFSPGKRLAKRILLLLATFFIIIALCQPHFRKKEVMVERRGADVIIAFDVSRSMQAKDILPNRLEKAKLEFSTLIDKLKGDRIGIVAFAGEAFIQCPLTLDRGAAKLFLSAINTNLIPTPGTAIGKAIRVALEAFPEDDKGFKAVILLTDGEDHRSDPLGAVAQAKKSGVKIFTIGIGTKDGSTLPEGFNEQSVKKDKRGQIVLSKLNENLLKEIAVETGGVYYRSTRGELELDKLVRQIRKIGQRSLREELSVEYEENYQYFLLFAILLLLAEIIVSERKTEFRFNFFKSRKSGEES